MVAYARTVGLPNVPWPIPITTRQLELLSQYELNNIIIYLYKNIPNIYSIRTFMRNYLYFYILNLH